MAHHHQSRKNRNNAFHVIAEWAFLTDDPRLIAQRLWLLAKPALAQPTSALIEFLRPVRERYTELAEDPGETERLLKVGADKAQQVAGITLAKAKEAIGLLPRA